MKTRKPVRYWGECHGCDSGDDVYVSITHQDAENQNYMFHLNDKRFEEIFGPFPKGKIFRFEVQGRVIDG